MNKINGDTFDNLVEKIKGDNNLNSDQQYEPQKQSPGLGMFKQKDKQKTFNYADNKESSRYNWEYALEQIEEIANDTEYIKEALKLIEAIGDSVDGTGASKADAIRETIKSREETNRKLIMFYQSIYEEQKPAKPNYQQTPDLMMQIINKKIERTEVEDLDMDEFMEFVNGIGELMQSVQKYRVEGK